MQRMSAFFAMRNSDALFPNDYGEDLLLWRWRLKWHCHVKMLQGHCTSKNRSKYVAHHAISIKHRRAQCCRWCQNARYDDAVWSLPVMRSTPSQQLLEMLCSLVWSDALAEWEAWMWSHNEHFVASQHWLWTEVSQHCTMIHCCCSLLGRMVIKTM